MKEEEMLQGTGMTFKFHMARAPALKHLPLPFTPVRFNPKNKARAGQATAEELHKAPPSSCAKRSLQVHWNAFNTRTSYNDVK